MIGWDLGGKDLSYAVVEADYMQIHSHLPDRLVLFWSYGNANSGGHVLMGSARNYAVVFEENDLVVEFQESS
jgi:hypothetical protein